MKKPLLATAVAAFALALPAVAEAGGGTPSEIQIVTGGAASDTTYLLTGVVKSSKQCEKGRTVELYDKGTGNVVDTDVTSKRGVFGVALRKSDDSGTYYIRALKTADCGSAKTPIVF